MEKAQQPTFLDQLGGYIDEEESPGDHKCLWIDVKESELIGCARDDRPPPIYRKATSKVPSVRDAFSEALNKNMKGHKLHEKAERLVESARANKSLTAEEAQLYEKSKDRLRRAVRYADSKCRKARTGHVPFSKKQKRLMGAMRVLRLIFLRFKLVGKRNSPRMCQLIKEL
jgi:hypothetical protein